jgi:hypothetical protein
MFRSTLIIYKIPYVHRSARTGNNNAIYIKPAKHFEGIKSSLKDLAVS